MAPDKRGLFSTLRHRDFALFIAAFTTSSIGSWAYNVALTVWLLDETGSVGWVAVATVARFVPALLFGAYAGVLADRFEKVRLMATLDVVLCLIMAVIAVEMAAGAHPVVVILTAAVSSALGMAYEPAAAAMTPQLVTERELGSANALRNTIDNVCVVAGPGLAAAVLLLGQPWLALVVNAATFAISALCVGMVRIRSTPVDVTEGGEAGPLKQMLVGVRTIAGSASVATMVAFSIIATFVFGIDTVLLVLLSRDILGTGAEGYGYLLAGLGLGGVVGAGLVSRLDRLPRLGTIILLGMAGYCLPTLLFLVVDDPTTAFAIQGVRGASTLVVDVLAVTALQRSLPPERLGRVFGAFDSLMLLAILIGSSLVPPFVALVGLDGAIWASGLGIPVLCLAGLPWLRRIDREAAQRRALLAPKRDLLAACDLFESISEGAVDQLAGAAQFVEVTPGTVVVAEDDAADAFYAIESGVFGVKSRGEDGQDLELQDMGAGTYFGEIGLIEHRPRTATVTARTAGRVLRVDGLAFVEALTEEAPSAALMDAASVRLGRTHPSSSLSRAALRGEGTPQH